MKTMEEYATLYWRKHSGKVSNVTAYSFDFTTLPTKKDEKERTYTVMLSYFWGNKNYN